jgi:hypothetical protein
MDFSINRTENAYFKEMPVKKVAEIEDCLKKKLISGYEPFAEDESPFINLAEDEVVADQMYSSYMMLNNLQRVMQITKATYFYALYYGTYYVLSAELEFTKAYRFRSDISLDLYNKHIRNHNIDLVVYGYLFCDDSFSWCIFQTPDVRILRGNEVFMKNYFESEERKIDEIETLIKDIHDPDLVEAPPRILRYLRYKKNGEWVYPEYKGEETK